MIHQWNPSVNQPWSHDLWWWFESSTITMVALWLGDGEKRDIPRLSVSPKALDRFPCELGSVLVSAGGSVKITFTTQLLMLKHGSPTWFDGFILRSFGIHWLSAFVLTSWTNQLHFSDPSLNLKAGLWNSHCFVHVELGPGEGRSECGSTWVALVNTTKLVKVFWNKAIWWSWAPEFGIWFCWLLPICSTMTDISMLVPLNQLDDHPLLYNAQ